MLPELIDIKTITKLNNELNERFGEIPFGNSQFQSEKFTINAQLTPARAYRAIGLNLSKCLQALQAAHFGYQKNQVDIEELEEKLCNAELGKYERKRKEIELAEKKAGETHLVKLVKDAAAEVEFYVSLLKKFPAYTREQFEIEERSHFSKKLLLQARGVTGPHESLYLMGILPKNELGKILCESENQLPMEFIAQAGGETSEKE